MARHCIFLYTFSDYSFRRGFFFFIPTLLALISSLFILFYISSTSNLFTTAHHHRHNLLTRSFPISSNVTKFVHQVPPPTTTITTTTTLFQSPGPVSSQIPLFTNDNGNNSVNNEVFHDEDMFREGYKEMNRSFQIYVYPHRKNDPFANVLLPVDFEPGGNYASEGYFKQVLMKSHFITKDASKADLFFLPFSITRLRYDKRVGVAGIQDFVRDYVVNISRKYPYWNRTGGADHFYVACHSVGKLAMQKADTVKFNAIQVVCSSSYFLTGYITHKDASIPQIWPRQGDPGNLISSTRKRLAFFAGAINSPVRKKLLQVWKTDSDIYVHFGRVKTRYADELLGSKFCLHVKGFEVNTARIADSLHYGCVPVIIADHYDLPFADILNWKSFSIVVTTLDIPLLKDILQRVSSNEYLMLQKNVMSVRKHFQWHVLSTDFDAFYMVMYELWLRRSSVRVLFNAPINTDKQICL